MGNKCTKQKNVVPIDQADEYTADNNIVELSENIIDACLNHYYRNNQSINNSSVIPKEINSIIIDYSIYFIVSSNALIKLNKSLYHSWTSLQSYEPIFSLNHVIQSILKQIQSKYDNKQPISDNEHITFTKTNYHKYQNNKITMEMMTDIAIDIIHDVLMANVVTREDVGDYLTHWSTFHDSGIYPLCYKFLYSYLKKHRLYEFCKVSNGNDLGDSLKYFMRDCEFDFPHEARKIERLLEAFANVYWEVNKDIDDGIWSDNDNVFVSTNLLLMINTSFHDPRIKPKDRLTMPIIAGMCGTIKTSNNELYIKHMLKMAQKIKECKM